MKLIFIACTCDAFSFFLSPDIPDRSSARLHRTRKFINMTKAKKSSTLAEIFESEQTHGQSGSTVADQEEGKDLFACKKIVQSIAMHMDVLKNSRADIDTYVKRAFSESVSGAETHVHRTTIARLTAISSKLLKSAEVNKQQGKGILPTVHGQSCMLPSRAVRSDKLLPQSESVQVMMDL